MKNAFFAEWVTAAPTGTFPRILPHISDLSSAEPDFLLFSLHPKGGESWMWLINREAGEKLLSDWNSRTDLRSTSSCARGLTAKRQSQSEEKNSQVSTSSDECCPSLTQEIGRNPRGLSAICVTFYWVMPLTEVSATTCWLWELKVCLWFSWYQKVNQPYFVIHKEQVVLSVMNITVRSRWIIWYCNNY